MAIDKSKPYRVLETMWQEKKVKLAGVFIAIMFAVFLLNDPYVGPISLHWIPEMVAIGLLGATFADWKLSWKSIMLLVVTGWVLGFLFTDLTLAGVLIATFIEFPLLIGYAIQKRRGN